jgi:DNA-binding HxlR family transcriptional regulator
LNRSWYARAVPLGTGYEGQACSLARTLEVVGERWTLLILRDLFFGVRRFSDLQRHLDIPRAVLATRLAVLADHGVVERRPDGTVLTPAGEELWPAVHALMQWGERHSAPGGPRRLFSHVPCGADLSPAGRCPSCGAVPPPAEIEMRPGPGFGAGPVVREDPVSVALRAPCRLLEPLAV